MGLIDRFRLRLLFDKGVKAAERGNYDEAYLTFQEVVDEDPGYALAHSNLGLCLFELGREDEALTAYDHALRLDPEDAQCIYDLGCILFKMDRHQDAIERFEEALRLEPEFSDARIGLRKAQQALDPEAHQDDVPELFSKSEPKPPAADPPEHEIDDYV